MACKPGGYRPKANTIITIDLQQLTAAIENGFIETSIFPFRSDGCNMSKLQVSAARTSYVDPCESIHIDNAINTGVQTDKNNCVDQGVTCLNPTVTGEHLRFLYPSLYARKAQADNIIGTLDDIIIDNQPKYLMLRESVRSRARATIEYESWHHPSKKQPKVTVPVINTFRTPSSPHRDDPDSPDKIPGSSSGLTGNDNFDKEL